MGGRLPQAASLLYYTPRVLNNPTWIPWDREALSGCCELARIALGNSLGLWAEWWAGEIQARPASSPPNPFFAGVSQLVFYKFR